MSLCDFRLLLLDLCNLDIEECLKLKIASSINLRGANYYSKILTLLPFFIREMSLNHLPSSSIVSIDALSGLAPGGWVEENTLSCDSLHHFQGYKDQKIDALGNKALQ